MTGVHWSRENPSAAIVAAKRSAAGLDVSQRPRRTAEAEEGRIAGHDQVGDPGRREHGKADEHRPCVLSID